VLILEINPSEHETFDVVGMGNAIVDILSKCEDSLLEKFDLRKGAMHLIDAERAQEIYEALDEKTVASGGSVCNTIAGLASLGLKTALIGKVANDALGESFTNEIRKGGTYFEGTPLEEADPTSRCFVLVTPDAQRTMNTYLGAASFLAPEDVDETLIASSQYVFFEGYLWDREEAKNAFLKAVDIAHSKGGKVAFSMSDVFCVEGHRDAFLTMIKNKQIDILFGDFEEYKSLFEVDNMDDVLAAAKEHCGYAVITNGSEGALAVIDGQVIDAVPAIKPEKLEDTTGAGDQFAAGFLAGLCKNLAPNDCLKLGIICASEVIAHLGPRPQTDMVSFVKQHGISL